MKSANGPTEAPEVSFKNMVIVSEYEPSSECNGTLLESRPEISLDYFWTKCTRKAVIIYNEKKIYEWPRETGVFCLSMFGRKLLSFTEKQI